MSVPQTNPEVPYESWSSYLWLAKQATPAFILGLAVNTNPVAAVCASKRLHVVTDSNASNKSIPAIILKYMLHVIYSRSGSS